MSDQSSDSAEKPNFEASLALLQNVVKRLEGGELSLEQALQQFEEGVRLTRLCQEYLASAEQRVEILMKEGAEGKLNLEPFGGSRS